jgi:hypothetical protein
MNRFIEYKSGKAQYCLAFHCGISWTINIKTLTRYGNNINKDMVSLFITSYISITCARSYIRLHVFKSLLLSGCTYKQLKVVA